MNSGPIFDFLCSNHPISIVLIISLIAMLYSLYRFIKLSNKGINKLTLSYLSLFFLAVVGIIYSYKAYEVFCAFTFKPLIIK
jgi:hypothetical protein